MELLLREDRQVPVAPSRHAQLHPCSSLTDIPLWNSHPPEVPRHHPGPGFFWLDLQRFCLSSRAFRLAQALLPKVASQRLHLHLHILSIWLLGHLLRFMVAWASGWPFRPLMGHDLAQPTLKQEGATPPGQNMLKAYNLSVWVEKRTNMLVCCVCGVSNCCGFCLCLHRLS